MLGLEPNDVRAALTGFDEKRYTNPTMMYGALAALGVPFRKEKQVAGRREEALAKYGLCRVQWEGPWLNPGVPAAAGYRLTHWIGTMEFGGDEFWVFDVNGGWTEFAPWERDTVPRLTRLYPRATGGWHVAHTLELFV